MYKTKKKTQPKYMTKASIIEELNTYGIDATFRPRKATLVALLEEKREEDNKILPDSPNIQQDSMWVEWTGKAISLMGAVIVITIGTALVLHYLY